MAETVYQVTIGERVLRVQLRRSDDGCFVRVDGGEERRVEIGASHGECLHDRGCVRIVPRPIGEEM